MKKNLILIVLTLVCKNKEILKKYNNLITDILSNYNIKIERISKLAPFVEDFFFNTDQKSIIKKLNKIFSKSDFVDVDICVQEEKIREKRIIACDMDMTAIKEETINILGEKVFKDNKIKLLTKKAMLGEIKFSDSITLRTKMFQGIKKSKITNILKEINITPGVKTVIKTMNHYGCHTMLITGGYDLIAKHVAKKIGFKEVISNSLIFKNNLITGELGNEIIDKEKKLKFFKKSIYKRGIKKNRTLAIGDGDNDLKMIKHASLGIAWRAYPKVRIAADITLENDFESILYFQGYNKTKILT